MAPKKKTTQVDVDVEEVRKQLLSQRAEILQKAQHYSIGSQDMARGDIVDQSTDLSERELMLGLAETDRAKLRNIEAALEMMDNNRYGICEECKNPIPIKRLLVVPTARYCVPCQEKLERMGLRDRG